METKELRQIVIDDIEAEKRHELSAKTVVEDKKEAQRLLVEAKRKSFELRKELGVNMSEWYAIKHEIIAEEIESNTVCH